MTEFIQTLILGLLVGGVYALLASGLTLIFGVMNVINIAHGAFLILAAFLTYSIWSATGLDPLLAIAFTTPAMFGFGWLLYNATIRPDPERAGGDLGAADLRARARARGG